MINTIFRVWSTYLYGKEFPESSEKTLQTRQPHLQEAFLPYKEMICSTQSTSDIDNSIAKRLDTGKTVVYCHTRHLAGKLFL